MIRILALLALLSGLAACGTDADLGEAPKPLGDFRLGHNIVVAPNLVKGPASREASGEEWIEAVTEALDARFRRYEGDRIYHFGVSVEGYVLARPGIPLVLSPKSALILNITVWDDAESRKLNAEPHTITVTEALTGETLLGSGLTQSREEQLRNLAVSGAKQVERWLLRQNRAERWFGGRDGSLPQRLENPGPRLPRIGPEEAQPEPASSVPQPAEIPAETQPEG
ncbi:MAG: hypothetical protein ACLFQL_01320 [Paracoccaceae bacterium]